MSWCRLFRPTSRLVRVTRALLILLTTVAIVGTIAVIHRMEAAPKFHIEVHSAQRALQELETCRNCSLAAIEEEGRVKSPITSIQSDSLMIVTATKEGTVTQSASSAGEVAVAAAAVAAAEIVSPEEALPEEMIPDQESPAVPAPVTKPEPPPVAENSLQQQEHAQQQETENNVSVDISTIQQPSSAVNFSRTVVEMNNNVPVDAAEQPSIPSPIRPRPVGKVQVTDIELIRNSMRTYPAAPSIQQGGGKLRELENPLVETKLLYEPGHIQPPKDVCPDRGEGLKLMILITTAPSHTAQREAVRSTWGHVAFRRDVGMAFMVGTSKDPRENELIAMENFIYGDIIQGQFIDTYNNLTLKTISMLEWTLENCERAKFLLKTDDDMYIHMPVLFSILDAVPNRRRTIIGKVARRWKPIRNITSKYYISSAQYKPFMYPDFNTGPAYILTNDIIEPLYRGALNTNFFKLEDVYVTGMVAGQLKIQHTDYPQFFNRRLKLDTCAVKKLASVHMVKTWEMFDLWKRLSDGLTKCPPK